MRKRYSAIILMITILVITLSGCKSYSTKDIANYGDFNNDNYIINLDLDIFPDQINNSVCNNYIFTYKSGLLDDCCQIYLDCTYNDKDYILEKSRIQLISQSVIIQDEFLKSSSEIEELASKRFSYPAYIVTYIEGAQYEYVLFFEEESRIVYIALQYCPITSIEFNYDYLPIDYN